MKTRSINDFHLDQKVLEVISWLAEKQIKCILVGGTPRDFLMRKPLGVDFDFEIHPLTEISPKQWMSHVDKVFTTYHKYPVKKLNYHVYRMQVNKYDLEFAMARKEIFKQNDCSHSNFDIEPLVNNDYQQSFKRRDLNINAIGIDILENQWVDPYQGKQAIEKEVIQHISDDFIKDPVRFLRLIRFSINTGFQIDKKTQEVCRGFKLKNLTSYYFRYEFFKAKDPNKFLQLFDKLYQAEMAAPEKILELVSELRKIDLPKNLNVEHFFIFLVKNKIEVKDIFLQVFEYSLKKIKKMKALHD